MKQPAILTTGDAYPRPWSVWADDVCLIRLAHEPSDAALQRHAMAASARGWNGTVLEVHRNGSWQREFHPTFE